MNLRRGRAAESLRGGGLSLGRGLLGVAGVACVGRGGSSRKDLSAELGDGVVADENTGLVL